MSKTVWLVIGWSAGIWTIRLGELMGLYELVRR